MYSPLNVEGCAAQATRAAFWDRHGALNRVWPQNPPPPPRRRCGRCVCTTLRWGAKKDVTQQMQRKKRSSAKCHGRLTFAANKTADERYLSIPPTVQCGTALAMPRSSAGPPGWRAVVPLPLRRAAAGRRLLSVGGRRAIQRHPHSVKRSASVIDMGWRHLSF